MRQTLKSAKCRPKASAGYWERQLPLLFEGEEIPDDVREAFHFADVTGYKGARPEEIERAKERLRAYVRENKLTS